MKSKSGFTIVELLIVIVVIAILATISIVAYNGIQQRASNTKTIAAVNQVVKSISGYIAANDTYPLTSNSCVVPAESSCVAGSTTYTVNTTLANNLNTISTLPSSIPDARTAYNGIVYSYSSTRTYNGKVQPAILIYSLKGTNQQCGIANLTDSGGTTMVTSATGYAFSDSGTTVCVVSIAGP